MVPQSENRPLPPAGAAASPRASPGDRPARPAVSRRQPALIVGSGADADVRLDSNSVSRAHALIVRSPAGTLVRDLGSRTHTFVNGRPVREADLHDGDELRVGDVRVRLKISRPPAPPTSPPTPALLVPVGRADARPAVRVESRTFVVGCDVVLDGRQVSFAHAVLYEFDRAHWVRDLGARTGTRVNGEQVSLRQLQSGDVVRFGETEFRYLSPPGVTQGPTTLDSATACPADVDEAPPPDAAIVHAPSPQALPPELAATAPGVEAGTAAAMVSASLARDVASPVSPSDDAEPLAVAEADPQDQRTSGPDLSRLAPELVGTTVATLQEPMVAPAETPQLRPRIGRRRPPGRAGRPGAMGPRQPSLPVTSEGTPVPAEERDPAAAAAARAPAAGAAPGRPRTSLLWLTAVWVVAGLSAAGAWRATTPELVIEGAIPFEAIGGGPTTDDRRQPEFRRSWELTLWSPPVRAAAAERLKERGVRKPGFLAGPASAFAGHATLRWEADPAAGRLTLVVQYRGREAADADRLAALLDAAVRQGPGSQAASEVARLRAELVQTEHAQQLEELEYLRRRVGELQEETKVAKLTAPTDEHLAALQSAAAKAAAEHRAAVEARVREQVEPAPRDARDPAGGSPDLATDRLGELMRAEIALAEHLRREERALQEARSRRDTSERRANELRSVQERAAAVPREVERRPNSGGHARDGDRAAFKPLAPERVRAVDREDRRAAWAVGTALLTALLLTPVAVLLSRRAGS